MSKEQERDYDIAYLAEQQEDNVKFAARFGLAFSQMFPAGCSVLDFGCGHGALSFEAAKTAASVVGVDLDERRVSFADSYARAQFPDLEKKVTFKRMRIEDLPDVNAFDVIVSKDTFEHVGDPESTAHALCRLMKPQGKAYIGFSPLWYSPFGDHGVLTLKRFPWAHLVLGERRFVAVHNSYTGLKDCTIQEAGFNGIVPDEFYKSFGAAGLSVLSAVENAAEGRKQKLMRLFNIAKTIPGLRKFFTVSMYLTLTKDRPLEAA